MGHSSSASTPSRCRRCWAELAELDVEFLGFHIFAGSQNLNAEILCEAQRKTVELALRAGRLRAGAGPLPEPRRRLRDPVLRAATGRWTSAAIGENLARLLADAIRPSLPEARVVIELGRYIVGECGFYVTRVVDRKESRGKTFLVVDGGLHHQLAASGNFGQVIRRNYPVAIGNRTGDDDTETVSVVGCLCTPLDLLADAASLPRADIGDLVVMFQAGAYGLTASPTAFLSHPAPAEVLV